MKTKSIVEFLSKQGIDSNVINTEKGILELPALPGVLIAVSESRAKQLEAFNGFRELSSKTGCTIASCETLDSPHGSTVVPGIGRVPVFSVFSGRLEDTFKTGGHKVINSRAMTVLDDYERRSTTSRAKTEYLSWICKALGINRPSSLAAFQDVMVEANAAPGSEVMPAIGELAIGRGTRTAVLTIGSDVEFGDTEPVVCESSYCFYDLERLQAEMTPAQAHVINKMTGVFEECINNKQQMTATIIPVSPEQRSATQQALELLSA
ncbi:hypothetical protein N9C98_01195 [Synechococcus sp. AH-224-G16]|nr:hypothetical protein [Synechococcus sp. AH-224-G16]